MKEKCVREFFHHGFTFIELIVGVGILMVLSGALVANYNSFASSQTVSQAAATLKNNLNAARTAAASGLKPDGCDTLVGYVVDFATTSSPPYYATYAFCDVGGTNTRVNSTQKVSTLPLGLTITLSPALPVSIVFYALDQGASANRTITIQGANASARIAVSTSGTVEDAPAP